MLIPGFRSCYSARVRANPRRASRAGSPDPTPDRCVHPNAPVCAGLSRFAHLSAVFPTALRRDHARARRPTVGLSGFQSPRRRGRRCRFLTARRAEPGPVSSAAARRGARSRYAASPRVRRCPLPRAPAALRRRGGGSTRLSPTLLRRRAGAAASRRRGDAGACAAASGLCRRRAALARPEPVPARKPASKATCDDRVRQEAGRPRSAAGHRERARASSIGASSIGASSSVSRSIGSGAIGCSSDQLFAASSRARVFDRRRLERLDLLSGGLDAAARLEIEQRRLLGTTSSTRGRGLGRRFESASSTSSTGATAPLGARGSRLRRGSGGLAGVRPWSGGAGARPAVARRGPVARPRTCQSVRDRRSSLLGLTQVEVARLGDRRHVPIQLDRQLAPAGRRRGCSSPGSAHEGTRSAATRRRCRARRPRARRRNASGRR